MAGTLKIAAVRRERVLYTALLMLAILLYIDPTYSGIGPYRVNRDIGPLKYILAFFASFSLLFDGLVLSGKSEAQKLAFSRGIISGAGILSFGLMVLVGSIYARAGDDISENFLQLSIASLFGYLSGLISVCAADRPYDLIERFFKLLSLGLLYALPMIVLKRIQHGQAFHTEIFLVMPVLVYWYFTHRSRLWRAGIALLMLATALALHKNIGYLTLAICVYTIIATQTANAADQGRKTRANYGLLFALGGLALIGLLLLVRLQGGDPKFVPGGSVEVRSFVYHQMWERFVDSPLFGDFYSSSSLVNLPFMEVLGNHHVTAHSDWLDALAHGGIVAALLLAWGTVGLLWQGPLHRPRHAALVPVTVRSRALVATLWTIAASGTVVSAFVSMLLALPIAFLFWTTMGLYVGIKQRN
jgi:hypothetical protein